MKSSHQDCKTAVESVQAQFEHWRNTRTKRGPIPNELWSAAIKLTEHYSVFYISKLLKLNYQSLKSRIPRTLISTYPKDLTTHFIELPSSPNCQDPCRIDISRSDGSRMQIHLTDPSATNLSSLVQAFLG